MRLALHVLAAPEKEAAGLAHALTEVKSRISPCSVCCQLTDVDPCTICTAHRRDQGLVCVVEDQAGLMAVERTKGFFGVYHVLGGHLSPMDDVGPDELTIGKLVERVRGGGVHEVILATNPNVEGEATALYVKRVLDPFEVKMTRIARGIPMGGDLEYSDALTLGRAFEGRNPF